jgi:DNA polymerase V
MIEAGIYDQDILVVDTSIKPRNGSIVMAVVNGTLTVKRLQMQDNEVTLLSDNPDYPSITITKEMSFFIQGVVTSVIRHFKLPH